jgi:exodeoxyribonuclease VII small subunit
MTNTKKSIDFEEALDQLEELVEDMENGDLIEENGKLKTVDIANSDDQTA